MQLSGIWEAKALQEHGPDDDDDCATGRLLQSHVAKVKGTAGTACMWSTINLWHGIYRNSKKKDRENSFVVCWWCWYLLLANILLELVFCSNLTGRPFGPLQGICSHLRSPMPLCIWVETQVMCLVFVPQLGGAGKMNSTITLQGINISHLGKRKIIFKMPFWGDMLVPWRVTIQCKTEKTSKKISHESW